MLFVAALNTGARPWQLYDRGATQKSLSVQQHGRHGITIMCLSVHSAARVVVCALPCSQNFKVCGQFADNFKNPAPARGFGVWSIIRTCMSSTMLLISAFQEKNATHGCECAVMLTVFLIEWIEKHCDF